MGCSGVSFDYSVGFPKYITTVVCGIWHVTTHDEVGFLKKSRITSSYYDHFFLGAFYHFIPPVHLIYASIIAHFASQLNIIRQTKQEKNIQKIITAMAQGKA